MLPLAVQSRHPAVSPASNLAPGHYGYGYGDGYGYGHGHGYGNVGQLESEMTAFDHQLFLAQPYQHQPQLQLHHHAIGPRSDHFHESQPSPAAPATPNVATNAATTSQPGPSFALRQLQHEKQQQQQLRQQQQQQHTSAGTEFPARQQHQHIGGALSLGEHSLRRKTPNGTIDAGYDGSPAQHAQGPPPLKHMILQGPSGLGLPAVSRLATNHTRASYPPAPMPGGPLGIEYGYTTPPMDIQHNRLRGPAMNGMPVGGALHTPTAAALPLQSLAVPGFPPDYGIINGRGTLGQVGGDTTAGMMFGVSPAWAGPAGAISPGGSSQYIMQAGLSPAVPGGHGHFFSSVRYPQFQHQGLGLGGLALGPGVALLPPGLGAGAGVTAGATEPVQFKDRVLAQAYRAYMDFVAHASAGGRSLAARAGLAPQATKALVYPKAPKPSVDHYALMAANPTSGYLGYDSATAPPMFADSSTAPSPPRPKIPTSLAAQASFDMLRNLCEQSKWAWVDGVLVGGCLLHALERYEEAAKWFSRILTLDPSRVDAISNMAAALYCLDRHDEAEAQWHRAVKTRPDYLEAVENLVTVLYRKKNREAVQAIVYVQQALWLQDGRCAHQGNWQPDAKSPGFGSSGYALPGSENGKMLALVHAKATLLYGLKESQKAAQAFEEAVMISTSRMFGGIGSLVERIRAALTQHQPRSGQPVDPVRSLLLLPSKARTTAQLVFLGGGDLPGLRFLPEGVKKGAAINTTSNSLLSLAKIFQDGMTTVSSSHGPSSAPFGAAHVLALYYLSLSLSESPSTANNVGILLAGVQPPSAVAKVVPTAMAPRHISAASGSGSGSGSGVDFALEYYRYGLGLDPTHVHLLTNYGSLLKDVGLLDAAIHKYEQAVARDPNFDIALTNLANAVKDRGRIKDAIRYYRRAVDANPDFAEAVCGLLTALNSVCDWNRRGGVFLHNGRFDRWHVADDGSIHDVLLTRKSSGIMKKVVDIVHRQLQAASKWGSGVLQPSVVDQLASRSVVANGAASQAEDLQVQLLRWAGRPWEGSHIVRFVERATRAKTRQWYVDRYERRQLAPTAAAYYSRPRLPDGLTVPTAPTVLPFHTFTSPLTARDIRLISQRNALRISCSALKSSWLPDTVYPPPRPPEPHLNVGYVSSDFNNHPLAHLMQSVFGLHDPAKAKAFCYATTPSDGSAHRQQIEREAPVFRDVSGWSSQAIVEQVVRDGIHILVNLNGYTRGARNEIFAARPAPIQMSFMGFAGTMGAEWCDYLLADETAVPKSALRPHRSNMDVADVFEDGTNDDNDDDDDDWVYSENIIYCRDTFFCCDHAQSCDPAERTATWEDEQRQRWDMRRRLFPGLPNDYVVLGNFNQLYKIDPTTFRSWLRILSRVPNAILWLLKFPDVGEENLKRTAHAWAGAEVASRIIFTDVAPKQEHISRARVCDLFLDTPECNAHTTAADVLWSSTPLLTLPRYPYKMCSRMAASILKGALPVSAEGVRAAGELIAADEDQYEACAVRLAGGLRYRMKEGARQREGTTGAVTGSTYPGGGVYGEGAGRLAELRKLLFSSKWTCALFDTKRWVSELERAYDEAWRRWAEGEERLGDIHL